MLEGVVLLSGICMLQRVPSAALKFSVNDPSLRRWRERIWRSTGPRIRAMGQQNDGHPSNALRQILALPMCSSLCQHGERVPLTPGRCRARVGFLKCRSSS
jgi:hypothetical protein